MKNSAVNIIQSADPDTDTFKCSKCGAIWRAKGEYEFDLGGWHYNGEDECPTGCKGFLGNRQKGKKVNRNK